MRRIETFTITAEHKNLTPFQFLSRVYRETKPGFLRQLFREDGVRVDGALDRVSRPLRSGSVLSVEWPVPLYERARRKDPAAAVTLLYQDDRALVVDKPAGLPVVTERVRSRATVVDVLPPELCADPATGVRPRVVHRLDKHTSGALLLARDRDAKVALCQDFLERKVGKEYVAWVRGVVREREGEVDVPISKDRRHALRMVADERHGKPSLTRFRVERVFDGYTRLALEPVTGRTHQIRVHLACLGFPILGDTLYGGKPEVKLSDLKASYRPKKGQEERPILDRQALHCRALTFRSPADGQQHRVEAPLAADLIRLDQALERYRDGDRRGRRSPRGA